MNKAKLVFYQTLMISTAILLGHGVQAAIYRLMGMEYTFEWPWYIPLSIILTGFLCSVPTLLLMEDDRLSSKHIKIRIFLHFVFLLAVVSLCGYWFRWYTDLRQYMSLAVIYVLIYIFVWVATLWTTKSDENRINEAIKEIQDEE